MSSLPYSPIERRTLTHRIPQAITATLLFGLVVFFGHELTTSKLFRVQKIELNDTPHVSETTIRHLGDIRYDQHLLLLDTTWIAQQIERHPWVKTASVTRSFPSKLVVDIEEYEPTLLLALERMWYVGEQGVIFRAADSHDINHPILTGIPNEWVEENPSLVQHIIQDALKIRKACDLPLLGSEENISEIHFQRETGFQVILRNGTTIAMGFYEPNGRIERLRKMLAKGLDLTVPQRIDLDADDIALTRPLN